MTNRKQKSEPVEFFEAAMGKPTSDTAVLRVVEALGGDYEVKRYEPSRASYDPDIARMLRWEFTRVPAANYYPTHLRVLDDVVVGMSLHADLVTGGHSKAVVLNPPIDEEVVLQFDAEKGAWAPSVIRRGDQYPFELGVPQGHWDGTYKFSLTSKQVEVLTDRAVWQRLWDELFRLCQASRFLDDPATLPGDAQRIIDRICGPS